MFHPFTPRKTMNTRKIIPMLLSTLSLAMMPAMAQAEATPSRLGYVIVTDSLPADQTVDVADMIQKVIDDNPNRTIYFPDRTYLLSHPILTPASPKTSVDLQLSNYAVIKAAPGWNSPEALVRLGAKDKANDIYTIGSNYSFTGGCIDGSDVANGISIDGGRETAIRNVSIKHTRVGIHIKHGANSGSSDSDIMSVNIVGNKAKDSIGVLVEGYDNTISNMRIANVYIGLDIRSGGNSLRNLHPLWTLSADNYVGSIGFRDGSNNNFYSFCYSDQFETGFRFAPNSYLTLDSCFCYWYRAMGLERAIYAQGKFEAVVNNLRIGFNGNNKENSVLKAEVPGGNGILNRASWYRPLIDNEHEPYLRK